MDLVVITGAGRGIGRAIASDLGKDFFLLLTSKTKSCEDVKNEIIKSDGNAESLILDISDYEKTESVVSEWINKKTFKNIGVVLAAGILGPKGPLTDLSLSKWDLCHKVNVLGNLAVLKGLLPTMIKNKFGRIITFAGGGSAYANPIYPAYASTKTSLVRISENIHEDLKDKGDFSIVCFGPGAVETDMLSEYRQGGGNVRKVVNISEPVGFVRKFICSKKQTLSGRFVHVTNNWLEYMDTNKEFISDDFWKLRRIETN